MQLYQRIQKGKTNRYIEYQPPSVKLNDTITGEQLVTAVGTLSVLAINSYRMMLPEKTFTDNRVKSVEEAVLRMFKDTGAKIDRDILEHVNNVWNRTMLALSSDEGGI